MFNLIEMAYLIPVSQLLQRNAHLRVVPPGAHNTKPRQQVFLAELGKIVLQILRRCEVRQNEVTVPVAAGVA